LHTYGHPVGGTAGHTDTDTLINPPTLPSPMLPRWFLFLLFALRLLAAWTLATQIHEPLHCAVDGYIRSEPTRCYIAAYPPYIYGPAHTELSSTRFYWWEHPTIYLVELGGFILASGLPRTWRLLWSARYS